jgi:hypothetical protein
VRLRSAAGEVALLRDCIDALPMGAEYAARTRNLTLAYAYAYAYASARDILVHAASAPKLSHCSRVRAWFDSWSPARCSLLLEDALARTFRNIGRSSSTP